jgi:15-cis-phytoene synthase
MTRKTSFYYSFLVLPPPERRAITAVFDFCRAVDDSVDLESDPARALAAAETWRAEVARVFNGASCETPQGRALQGFVEPFHLPRAQFEALIDGVAMDARPGRFQTFADLEPYCHRVASSVGLICAEIFGYSDPQVLTYARDLGVALQLTNILRDVGVDYRQGRMYLPLEDLARFGCSEDDVRHEVERAAGGVTSDRMRHVLEHHAARARVFFARALRALPEHDAPRFVAAEIMRAIYWRLLQRIEAERYDVFTRLIRVPKPTQAVIAIAVWARSRMRRAPSTQHPAPSTSTQHQAPSTEHRSDR